MKKFINKDYLKPLSFSFGTSFLFLMLWDIPRTTTWYLNDYSLTLTGLLNYLLILFSLFSLALSAIFLFRLLGNNKHRPNSELVHLILGCAFIINPLTVSFLSTHNLIPLVSLISILIFARCLLLQNNLLIILIAIFLKISFSFLDLYSLLIIASILVTIFLKGSLTKKVLILIILLTPLTTNINIFLKSLLVVNDQYLIITKDLYPYNLWSKTLMGLLENYYTNALGPSIFKGLMVGSVVAFFLGNRTLRILIVTLFLLTIMTIPSFQSIHFKNTTFHLNILRLPLLQPSIVTLYTFGLFVLFLNLNNLTVKFLPKTLIKQAIIYGLIVLFLLFLTPSFLVGTLIL
ncbi:hypothetical protein A2631_02805 [Candidatus Daviesbacteria bacterium RIFCSPHIGHO2_01_FULL_44_29]|uniref:Uncharacterized protein n=1 Tax=Candidatus Daviesbacteria bacterium RIFCSPHIGHO2_02_FULL_43_12 TaxID=1797776 RepID=A0A1F5KKB2_9BACT|nr:MAG: hypothetical protein A2631_02805 [Candidatus Daviesbacteria bacterium RIFCSPHIGHO2_01_FULL_44_29]OGE40833.1 MAG: hypothetical protein A3E86_02545 [Candidatus Daviesbacteria bacterium RIFCSPHIGHO2_12_FULL_47_45]OGE41314.1 MAG: hypothetical protein A3D25_02200 [Candidatus Daviesbacteria bacterium RIFCSPHIGHO2_02_FULL_43_12]OGE69515.1 MAG: hypothetical protein A3B55_03940 [Candidatus Daviesbacteria bacterium RIFCSPLOWO2_01_FULL_43_15]